MSALVFKLNIYTHINDNTFRGKTSILAVYTNTLPYRRDCELDDQKEAQVPSKQSSSMRSISSHLSTPHKPPPHRVFQARHAANPTTAIVPTAVPHICIRRRVTSLETWSTASVSFARGSGPSGTGTPRNLHNGPQPSFSCMTRRFSGGTISLTEVFQLTMSSTQVSHFHPSL